MIRIKKILLWMLKYIPLGFLIIVIFINISFGLVQHFTKSSVPMIFGFSELVVISGSMEPAISAGDVVIIAEKPYNDYQVGDIVTYLTDDGFTTTHRIVQRDGDMVTMKGDYNNTADTPVFMNTVKGKVMLVIPKIGKLILFCKTPRGMFILFLVAILFIYGEDYVSKMIKKRKQNTNK